MSEANRRHFGFQIEEFAERMQVSYYSANQCGFFDWHADVGDGRIAVRRKLTMVVQLSDDGSYEGGSLGIKPKRINHNCIETNRNNSHTSKLCSASRKPRTVR